VRTKICVVLAFLLCCVGEALAQGSPSLSDTSKIQHFILWKTLDNPQKLTFLSGFTNGLLTGLGVKSCSDKSQEPVVECVLASKELTWDQAAAMVDKYFKDNPEKWNMPIGDAIFQALTVKSGPCQAVTDQK